MQRSLNYKDVHLVPNYSELKSRAEADTSVQLGKFKFKLPVVPANMASCIDMTKATWLAQNGYFYILHRFYEYDEILNWMRRMNKCTDLLPFISISIGIKQRDIKLMATILEEKLRLDYVTVDVAHGDHEEVHGMLAYLHTVKRLVNPDLFVIGGNIATSDAYLRMAHYIDAAKVGIACGASCFVAGTKVKTKDGYKSIQNVKLGDYVLTHSKQYKKVTNTIIKYAQDLLEVNQNICTLDHKFYVVNVEDVKNVSDSNIHDYAFWVEAKDLDKDKHFLIQIQDQ
jgi:hypothetical protein